MTPTRQRQRLLSMPEVALVQFGYKWTRRNFAKEFVCRPPRLRVELIPLTWQMKPTRDCWLFIPKTEARKAQKGAACANSYLVPGSPQGKQERGIAQYL